MQLDTLAAMDVLDAEIALKNAGITEISVQVIDTFKLSRADCVKVISARRTAEGSVSLICGRFTKGVRQDG